MKQVGWFACTERPCDASLTELVASRRAVYGRAFVYSSKEEIDSMKGLSLVGVLGLPSSGVSD